MIPKLLKPIFLPFDIDFFCTQKKFLVFHLVSRNLKIKYRRSILGVLWTLLSPLAMTAVYYFVFNVVMNVQIPFRLVFFMSGILFWNFISQTIMEGMDSLVGNMGLVTKVPVPLNVFPFVGTITNLITLLFSMPILLGAAILSGAPLSTSLVLMPIYGLLLFLMIYSISFCLGVLYVFLRDLKHLMGIVISIWFYASPVIYNDHMIPEKYKWILYANPFGMFFSDMHLIWTQGGWPSLSHFLVFSSWSLSFVFAAIFFYKKFSKGLVELL
jgi:ABC-type polysaccharide/polyol phosphate export permease